MAIIHKPGNLLRGKIRRSGVLTMVLKLAAVLLIGLTLIYEVMHLGYCFQNRYPDWLPVPEVVERFMNTWKSSYSARDGIVRSRRLIHLARPVVPVEWGVISGALHVLVAAALGVADIVFALAEVVLFVAWPLLLGVILALALWRIAAGKKSERQIEQAFWLAKKLPDSCHVFVNKIIWHGGGSNKMDLIIVGPGGVGIVEVKNYSGRISGRASDRELRRIKPNGEQEMIANPARQVGKHRGRLTEYLWSQDFAVGVTAYVLLTHPKAELDVKQDGTVPFMLRSLDRVAMDVIRGSSLTPQQVEDIVQAIGHNAHPAA